MRFPRRSRGTLLLSVMLSVMIIALVALLLFKEESKLQPGPRCVTAHVSNPEPIVIEKTIDVTNSLETIPLSDILVRSLPCTTNTTCDPRAHSKVILLTYMRSGSTFTGDILSAHPDVFYFYEPLHWLVQEKHVIFDYLQERKIHIGKDYKPYLMRKYMSAIMNCDLAQLDFNTLTQYHLKNSVKTSDHFNCLIANPGLFGLLKCLPALYRACHEARVILAKTIVLPMSTAEVVFTRDRKLKIVHLIRDPRATIWSEGKYGLYKERDFWTFADSFCETLRQDLKYVIRLKTFFPRRVKIVLYENISERPLREAMALYDFMNVTMLPSVARHIRNITMNGNEEHCPLCVSKANSALASQNWRYHLGYYKAKFIDEVCGDVYRYLGYKIIRNENEYRNISYPLHTEPHV